MTLRQWIALQGGIPKAAKILEIQPSQLHKWLKGRTSPNCRSIRKIYRLAGGAVSHREIVEAF